MSGKIDYDNIINDIHKTLNGSFRKTSDMDDISIYDKSIFKELKKISKKINIKVKTKRNVLDDECFYGVYIKDEDRIEIRPKRHISDEEYCITLIHEMCHSTGHRERLNRFKRFDHHKFPLVSVQYGVEEVIAETSAFIIGNLIGLYIGYDYFIPQIKKWYELVNEEVNTYDKFDLYALSDEIKEVVEYLLA